MTKEPETPTEEPKKRRPMHQIFGDGLDLLLSPLGLHVDIDLKVQGGAPRVDVLIRRESGETWTPEQWAFLCDGIREVNAAHVLIEFKFKENLNEDTLFQGVSYYFLYKRNRKLKEKDVRAFIVCSQTPQKATLERFGFQPGEAAGVFHSSYPLAERTTLILLNQLDNTPYNAAFKMFASKKKESKKAIATLEMSRSRLSGQFWDFTVMFCLFCYNIVGGIDKLLEMTREQGKKFFRTSIGRTYLESLPLDDKLAGVPKDEIRAYLARNGNSEDARD